jgi:hypothetical protein
MQAAIEAVKQWPDGGMSLKVAGNWYKTKNPEMMAMQGQVITFEPHPWTNPQSGKTTNWINDYSVAGGAPTTADQAFNAAMQQPQQSYQPPPMGAPQQPAPQPAPQPPARDRDASIIAQALTKACTGPGDDVQQVWSRYCSFYRFALKGVPDTEKPAPAQMAPPPTPDGFDDDIPF